MGLAVLPARLKVEMAKLAKVLVEGGDVKEDDMLVKHSEWVDTFRMNYSFTQDNVDSILEEEIGKVFVRVLEDAGVYKCTDEGRAAFMRFVQAL